ncbi:MAG: preprotein translocase subunit SecY [Methylacidiphilales bacterium]|nr:preprotein translocase subunit SecY [Candidatus Methylacidiphilales bacterium]
MLSAFANCFKIPELRQRILFTLAIVVVVRIGAAIPCPGINTEILAHYFRSIIEKDPTNSVIGMFNLFSGGAVENCAVFSLGIIPYISASIMLQLMTAVVPSLGKLAREEGGRQKITQYTRYATILICVFQGYFYARQFETPEHSPLLPNIAQVTTKFGPLVSFPGPMFEFTTILSLLAGTLLLMWLGEQITDKGIGNGISMVITINIVSRLPAALLQGWQMIRPPAGSTQESNVPVIAFPLMLVFLFGVIAGTIAITQAMRKVTIQYAKQVRGNKVYGGQSAFLPLKVNYSGVMPIIFAQSILLGISFMLQILPIGHYAWATQLVQSLLSGSLHYAFYIVMIFFFSYLWVSFMFNPIQIAEDVKRNGGFIPGVRPGNPTADFLEYTMTRLTLAGAIFLAILAILPMAAQTLCQIPMLTSQFFGGTSLLIMIGVMLDTMRQMETYLLQRHYDGFLKKGRIRGRSASSVPSLGQGHAVDSGNYVWLFVLVAIILIVGAVFSLV